jgi:hypothetical protein
MSGSPRRALYINVPVGLNLDRKTWELKKLGVPPYKAPWVVGKRLDWVSPAR